MSTKFEQLLDYLVNEEMDKANELFHEIVVEKSREIYENMIAEEAEDDEEQDESVEEASEDDEQDESVQEDSDEDDEEQDESIEEGFGDEDEAAPGGDDETSMTIGGSGDSADDLEQDVAAPEGDVSSGEEQIIDILSQLKSEFEAIVAKHGGEEGGEEPAEPSFGGADDDSDDDQEDDQEDDSEEEDESMGQPMREYVETVGNDWHKNSMKSPGPVGSGKGDKAGQATETSTQSVGLQNPKGRIASTANAKNILGSKKSAEGTNTGTSPNGKTGGLVKNPQNMNTGNGNVPGGKMGVKNLAKVAGGHGAEKKGSGPGPVGAGTGDKAGQTSVGKVVSPLNGAPGRHA